MNHDARGRLQARKKIRLSRESYKIPGYVYSITVCCAEKRAVFMNAELSETLDRELRTHPVGVGVKTLAFCLMPNHVHLLLQVDGGDIIAALQGWKSRTTHQYWNLGGEGRLWQRSFYDHGIRGEEDLRAAALYIVNNPLRANVPDRKRYTWSLWCT